MACVLRVVDYAHINWERATSLDRALHSHIEEASLVHWSAQANISGPLRDVDQLVYGCNSPIDNIDAWWQFFDLASGLNKEIRSVRDYLNSRNASTGRFSLSGVKGVDSPELFANLIRLASDIAPIDLRVQPDSMERVIQLLGGEAIYRSDRLAPVRELIQNARDAIALRHAMETANEETIIDGRIDITLDLSKSPAELLIHDNGIGMTEESRQEPSNYGGVGLLAFSGFCA